jgi:hypothetical protein
VVGEVVLVYFFVRVLQVRMVVILPEIHHLGNFSFVVLERIFRILVLWRVAWNPSIY